MEKNLYSKLFWAVVQELFRKEGQGLSPYGLKKIREWMYRKYE